MKKIALSLLAALTLAACAADDAPVASEGSAVDEVTLPDAGADDLKVVCTRREMLPCGYLFGRTLYCSMCVCEQIVDPPCTGPECYGCAAGF